jgi:UDPglucose 6-dehydrogenase
MKVCVVGTGYVGLVSGAGFAEIGHHVVCVDIDEAKIQGLKEGRIPIYEPGLEELVLRNGRDGRLAFTTQLKDGVETCDIIFIAVGTPPNEDGTADLQHVLAVAKAIGQTMNGNKIVVNKSTVPVGTGARVEAAIREALTARGVPHKVSVVSNPEFLKEGDAINDFMRPDRVVIGCETAEARAALEELYAPFVANGHPILFMDRLSSELTKYAANAMLATRISFMNEIAALCEKTGADVQMIRKGIGTDQRIGMPFLYAGLGYGGSCFPKDVKALAATMAEHGLAGDILNAVELVNNRQRKMFAQKIIDFYKGDVASKTFAVWGLAFKPKTDDMREAPAVDIIKDLATRGAKFRAYDPEAMNNAKGLLKGVPVTFCKEQYEALDGADALILMTEWGSFRSPDFDAVARRLSSKTIFDGRNQYQPAQLKERGFSYLCIGRPSAV